MHVLTIVGARPQFIKASVVSLAFQDSLNINETILHTGQHFDINMSDVFFDELGIPAPGWHLGIASLSHGAMTGRQLEKIEEILLSERPDLVLVYGDTNSTLAGALAASKLHIPIAHVEAGLRSWNRKMPEEINRVVTDHLSEVLFPPTNDAVENLNREGITQGIYQVGDVMLDCARHFGPKVDQNSGIFKNLNIEPGYFRLCTIHRQENTDNPKRLAEIFAALQILSEDMPLVLPMHPRTASILREQGNYEVWTKDLIVLDPVGFLTMTALIRGAALVLTDSGGLQKEAYFHSTPVVILRDETEWTDLLTLGWARLVIPDNKENILQVVSNFIDSPPDDNVASPYGDGNAAKQIVEQVTALLNQRF